jgi:arginyl-tRNA--protein-N-Asp/Glu arginylyltransferase
MAKLIAQEIEDPRACSYLPAERAQLENRVMVDVTPEELEAMLERGWRRFGPVYFRPACAACEQCIPTRVLVDPFEPSRSQSRAFKRAQSLRVEVSPPRVDAARLALYDRWHRGREERRGWTPNAITEREYLSSFAFPHPCAREIALYEGERLVGIGICDVTPRAWSAVYFFYDASDRRLSLGTANVLLQIELARQRGIPFLYLGYRVDACDSLRYKGAFQPQQRLIGRPGFNEPPRWVDEPAS